ncbi:MAG: hypothetical protein JOY54_20480 [Acidobacteriaceae bacterium]|nr:hypothetical protein [Acidobacteriaceae bacterium]
MGKPDFSALLEENRPPTRRRSNETGSGFQPECLAGVRLSARGCQYDYRDPASDSLFSQVEVEKNQVRTPLLNGGKQAPVVGVVFNQLKQLDTTGTAERQLNFNPRQAVACSGFASIAKGFRP